VNLTLFGLFFASGFCSLLYQVVWVRMAFAQYGIITPVLSVVLSVFMAGLGIGSYAGGRLTERLSRRWGVSPAYFYCVAEAIIGIGAFVVPLLLGAGGTFLLTFGPSESATYLLLSALFIVGSILPWCIMMGATFPLMMAFVRQTRQDGGRSFSFLYLANVIGAMTGTAATALVLVEVFGFTYTYVIAAVINFIIAAVGTVLARAYPYAPPPDQGEVAAASAAVARPRNRWVLAILFLTGFASLAMEVVWTRAFTFVLHTTIYAFAMILATYLLATWLGSAAYKLLHRTRFAPSDNALLGLLAIFALIPVVLNDPSVHQRGFIALLSIVPLCGGLGYLTPKLVDDYARGNPDHAGYSYSINILGGILGPLAAGYLMLPYMDVRAAQILLAVPFIILALVAMVGSAGAAIRVVALAVPVGALLFVSSTYSRSYEEGAHTDGPRVTRRDHVASVVAFGEGFDRGLLVNGVGIARLTPITKVMAHLSLTTHGDPKSAVAICFGMGTTLRSMQRWGIEATGIDLTRSVLDVFGFYHADADQVAADPRIAIVADDGRRFLLRSKRRFDVIAVDPPPPPEAAGSSLLYSTQFYDIVKLRLAPGGLFHQWIPTGNPPIMRAVARTLRESFPHVVFFFSIEDWGYHALASMTPIPDLTPEEMLRRMPEAARKDLMEWYPDRTIDDVIRGILSRRTDYAKIVPDPARVPTIHDDRPYNEYYFLRHRGLMP